MESQRASSARARDSRASADHESTNPPPPSVPRSAKARISALSLLNTPRRTAGRRMAGTGIARRERSTAIILQGCGAMGLADKRRRTRLAAVHRRFGPDLPVGGLLAFDRAGEDVLGRRETLLARAWEMDAHARAPGAAQLPPRRVKPVSLRQVAGARHALAVGESKRLRAGAGEPETDLASGLQVVRIGVERAGLLHRHELDDGGKAAGPLRGLDAGPAEAMLFPLPPPALGQQNVTLGAQRRQLALQGRHARLHLGDPPAQLRLIEGANVVAHPADLKLSCAARRRRNAANSA